MIWDVLLVASSYFQAGQWNVPPVSGSLIIFQDAPEKQRALGGQLVDLFIC